MIENEWEHEDHVYQESQSPAPENPAGQDNAYPNRPAVPVFGLGLELPRLTADIDFQPARQQPAGGIGDRPISQTAPLDPVMERSRQLWRVLEPTDLTDYYDHAIKAWHAQEPYHYMAIGASKRGRAHAHDAKYREDAFRLDAAGQWMLLAVADGQGSKSLSRVGANIVVNAAVDFLKSELMQGDFLVDLPSYLECALTGAMIHALAELHYEAAKRRRNVMDLATTLLLTAVDMVPDNSIIGVAQVGDGGIAAKKSDGSLHILGKPDRGMYAGQTLFLTNDEVQQNWARRVTIYRSENPIKTILLATDGVWDDFNEPLGRLDDLFTTVESLSDDGPDPLLEWLDYERRSSFDDRTLVVLSYKGEQKENGRSFI